MGILSPGGGRFPEKLPGIAGRGVLGIMATKKEGPTTTSRVTRKKRTTAPRTARVQKLAEAAGLDVTIAPPETENTGTGRGTGTFTGADPVIVTETVSVTATVSPAAAILPPPVERVTPKHPWFGEPPARLLAKFLDAWKRRVEKRIAARAPWISRLVARYGPAFMQQRKPVE
jgi:hypothetical protein